MKKIIPEIILMKRSTLVIATLTACVCIGATAWASPVSLGTADSFAVLGGSTVTNTGPTSIFGNLGVSPGTSITGFPPGIVTGGTIHFNDATAIQAQADALSAYNTIAGLSFTLDLTGNDLGGLTLTPGIYHFDSAAQLTGALTLDGLGLINPQFIFQIGSTFTTASASSVVAINGADASDVFFQVGSSTTLGTDTVFAGNIIASANDTLTTGASVDGRVFALNGAVTLDTNTISAVPEPSGVILLGFTATLSLLRRKRGCQKWSVKN